MLLVLAAGAATRGSKRWINLGFFKFQPSEFGKVLFVLVLAGFLAERSRSVSSTRTVVSALGYAVVPIVLVFVQPDIGTALVYSSALAAVLFVAGVRWLHLGILAAITVVGALLVLWLLPSAGVNVLKPYQKDRLIGFTHPNNDPRGATYNVQQSITAVGAGGLRGRGVLGATQTRLNYLPEHATDFAFASLAEEHGFFGVAVLLLLYLLVVWRALKIVAVSRDLFCAIVAGGIAFMFLFQVFVNSAMTMGIAPITGIPLPFVSVGGSSMITNFLAIGILQAIHARRVRRA
jgi:rod shape determining protein RodA